VTCEDREFQFINWIKGRDNGHVTHFKFWGPKSPNHIWSSWI